MTDAPAPFFESSDVTIWNADARHAWQWLPENSVDAIVTSPPYWGLRDYGVNGQLGLEDNPEGYVTELADMLTGYARVLKAGGSLWLNLGDTYNTYNANRGRQGSTLQGGASHDARPSVPSGYGLAAKDWQVKCLLMVPERVALALIDRGWILRNKVAWTKPNGMPESVRDRLATKWEYLFHLVRQPRYYYDLDAIRRPTRTRHSSTPAVNWAQGALAGHGKTSILAQGWAPENSPGGANPGDVWDIPTRPYPEAHFAVFPPELVRRPILATVPKGDVVLDPFFGSGTTGVMARRLGRRAWGIELNVGYCRLAAKRFMQEVLPL